ncbi:MAG: hypothetical protein O7I93_12710 [Gemmatimonadetes bacterium]|nr:hypothetical protein [Gemmatimonadota bacterium]
MVLGTLGLLLQVASGAVGQTPLDRAVEQVRVAWLRHDYEGLVASSDTVRLQLPEVGRSPAVNPAHAASVLEEYLSSANEIAFEVRQIRPASEDHAYAQIIRRYVVKGTSDERVETVFLGFRRIEGRWRLREVRVTP